MAWERFFKSKIRIALISSLSLWIGFLFRYSIAGFVKAGNGKRIGLVLGFTQNFLKQDIIFFILLLLLSFTYFCDTFRNETEKTTVTFKGEIRQVLLRYGVMSIVVLFYYLVVAGTCSELLCFTDAACFESIRYFLVLYGVYIVLHGQLACLLGLLFARIKKKIIAYVGVILLCIFMSPFMGSFLHLVSQYGSVLTFRLVDLLCLMPGKESLAYNAFYLWPVNLLVVTKPLLWFFIGFFILVISYSVQYGLGGKTQWVLWCGSVALIVGSLGCCVMPGLYYSGNIATPYLQGSLSYMMNHYLDREIQEGTEEYRERSW